MGGNLPTGGSARPRMESQQFARTTYAAMSVVIARAPMRPWGRAGGSRGVAHLKKKACHDWIAGEGGRESRRDGHLAGWSAGWAREKVDCYLGRLSIFWALGRFLMIFQGNLCYST